MESLALRCDQQCASPRMNNDATCRFCGGSLAEFVDLGMSPLCESYLAKDQLNSMEAFYPLVAYVCRDCHLVQLQEYVAPELIFSEYAYFSAYSDAWLDHARRYVASMTGRLGLGPASRVIELGSNDGYLLQFFVERGISVLGIDPAANVARAAEQRGVPTLVKFFGVETARAYSTSKSCGRMAARCASMPATPATQPTRVCPQFRSWYAASGGPACTASRRMPISPIGFERLSASC